MKMYGLELTIENGKLKSGSSDGMTFYPMRWNTKEKHWEYCVGKYTKEYFRKLLKNNMVRFDFLTIIF